MENRVKIIVLHILLERIKIDEKRKLKNHLDTGKGCFPRYVPVARNSRSTREISNSFARIGERSTTSRLKCKRPQAVR